jgi:hypothetical protein
MDLVDMNVHDVVDGFCSVYVTTVTAAVCCELGVGYSTERYEDGL